MLDDSQLLSASQAASEFPVTAVITGLALIAIAYLVYAGVRDIRRTRQNRRDRANGE